MDGGGRRWGEGEEIFTPPAPPLSLFWTVDRPLDTNLFLSPVFRSIKIKDGGHTLVKKLLSTRSPKLRLFYKLAYMRHHPNLQENYDIFRSDL